MKNNKLGELDFANLNDEDMKTLQDAEDVINRASGKKVYLMALCKD